MHMPEYSEDTFYRISLVLRSAHMYKRKSTVIGVRSNFISRGCDLSFCTSSNCYSQLTETLLEKIRRNQMYLSILNIL